MSDKTNRPWLMAAILLVVSLAIAVVFLIIVELSLRMIYPEKVREYADEQTRIGKLAYDFHPDYLIALKPNVEKVTPRRAENGGEAVRWRTNSDGFRGEPLREHAGARIIVYGDSNIQGDFSQLERTYAYRLEHYLRLSGADVEVINGGVVGFWS